MTKIREREDYPARYTDPAPDAEIVILRDIVELERKAWSILVAMQGAGVEPTLDVVRQSIKVRKAELRLAQAIGEKR